jgi:hypothetical protein
MQMRAVRKFALVAAAMTATMATAQTADEYQVKAAFVFNFAKFIEWPAQAFQTPKDPVTVCVLGHNPFGNTLEEVIHGKSIDGRSLVYRQISDAESASTCQILFVATSECKRFRAMHGNLKPLGILSVGEAEGFASDGGVINFKVEDGRVRFEINLEAAERQQLHISSKLLSLAQIVKTEKLR